MYSSKRRSRDEIAEVTRYEKSVSLAAYLRNIAYTSSQVDELKRLSEWGYMTFFESYMLTHSSQEVEALLAAKELLEADTGIELDYDVPDVNTKRDILAAWKQHLELQLQDNFSKTQINKILRVSKSFLVSKTNSK